MRSLAQSVAQKLGLAFVLTSFIVMGAPAKPEATEKKSDPSDSPTTIFVEADPATTGIYNQTIEMRIRIASKDTVSFESLCVELPAELCSLYAKCESNNEICSSDNVTVGPGRPKLVRQWLQPKVALLSSNTLRDPKLHFLLTARDWPVWIKANKVSAGGSLVSEPLKISLQPEFMASVFGAAIGSLLLSLFLSLKDFLNAGGALPAVQAAQPSGPAGVVAKLPVLPLHRTRMWNLFQALLRVAARATYFTVVTLMLLLIAKVTTGFESPVNVEIKDFWGGVALALFAIPVSRWLDSKLQ